MFAEIENKAVDIFWLSGEWQKKIQTYFSIQLRHVLTVTSYIKILELLLYLGNEKWEIGNT